MSVNRAVPKVLTELSGEIVSTARFKVRVSPSGRRALIYPFDNGGRSGFGLVDINSGVVGAMKEGEGAGYRLATWIDDDRAILTSLTNIDEVNVANRSVTHVVDGDNWTLGFRQSDELFFVRNPSSRAQAHPRQSFATISRQHSGWGSLVPFDTPLPSEALNLRYQPATNGRVVVGVSDGLTTPPNLAVYDLQTKTTRLLTDYNTHLKEKRFGEVSTIEWSGPYDKGTSFGYLIKPVGYVPGRRYPLIVALKDHHYHNDDFSFIIDGQDQYSGDAIQVWANDGFMVLFTPFPKSLEEVYTKPEDPIRVQAHIESGVDYLDKLGLIDTNRLAITGWSRSGYYTQYILSHSKKPFLAGAQIDNIQYNLMEYVFFAPTEPLRSRAQLFKQMVGAVPWGETSQRWYEQASDFALNKIKTPLLIESHGVNLLALGETFIALRSQGLPVELYSFPDAAHNLKAPQHRWASLNIHTDWFRFWLQGYEDADPGKVEQYRRWRQMKADWEKTKKEDTATKPGEKR